MTLNLHKKTTAPIYFNDAVAMMQRDANTEATQQEEDRVAQLKPGSDTLK